MTFCKWCYFLEKSRFKPQIEDIIKISVENVYQSKEVIQKEVMGHRAITTLLEYYCEAAVRSFNNKANVHDKLILSLVPEGISMAGETLYETLLNSLQLCNRETGSLSHLKIQPRN